MGYKKLGIDILLMTIGNFASKILSFLIIPLYTAYLTTSDYGIADLITTTCALCFPFFTATIGEAMMRFALDNKESKDDIFNVGLSVWGMGTILFLFLSPIFCVVSELKDYYMYLVLYYITYSFQNTMSYFLRGINKIKIYAVGGVVNTFVLVSLNVLFLTVLKMGLIGYLISYIITGVIMSLWWIFGGRLYLYPLKSIKSNKKLSFRMIAYSLPMVPNSLSWWISASAGKYFLLYFSGTAINGLFSVANKIPTILTTVNNIFISAWRISSIENFGSEKSRLFWNDVFSKYTALMFSACAVLLASNKLISSVLFSNDFYVAWKYVPVLLLASLFHCYAEFFGTVFLSAYVTRMLFISTAAGAIVNILLNLILIPFLSAYGASIATLISYTVVFIMRYFGSKKIMKIKVISQRAVLIYCMLILQTVIGSFDFSGATLISCFVGALVVSLSMKDLLPTLNKMINKCRGVV